MKREEKMNEDPEKMFLTTTGPAVARTEGVLPGLSQDLLQQAMHEVSQQSSASLQEVKEEPGIYNRMEQILANQEVRLGGISHLHNGDPVTVTDSLDKVKLEPHTPKIVPSGGGGGGGGGASQMILIPTLQSDGTVAYAVQQNNTTFHRNLPLHPGPLIPASQTSPSKVQHKVGLLRPSPSPLRPKNILPKTFQPQPPCLPGDTSRNHIGAPVRPPGFPPGPRVAVAASLQKLTPGEGKIQLSRAAGESKTVALSYSGAEVNIRCDQQLSQLELHHVQSIIRQAQPGQQVYRVVTPSTAQGDRVSLEQEQEGGKEEEKEQHFSVAALVRQLSSGRGRGKKHRGRPRKGTSKINEKKVITELRREFGIRNEWSRLKIKLNFFNKLLLFL